MLGGYVRTHTVDAESPLATNYLIPDLLPWTHISFFAYYYPVREHDFQSSKSHATLSRAVSALLLGSSHCFSGLAFSLRLIAFVLTMASRLQQIQKHLSDPTIMSGGRSSSVDSKSPCDSIRFAELWQQVPLAPPDRCVVSIRPCPQTEPSLWWIAFSS